MSDTLTWRHLPETPPMKRPELSIDMAQAVRTPLGSLVYVALQRDIEAGLVDPSNERWAFTRRYLLAKQRAEGVLREHPPARDAVPVRIRSVPRQPVRWYAWVVLAVVVGYAVLRSLVQEAR